VNGYSQTPEIYRFIVGSLEKDFRGYITQGSKRFLAGLSWTESLREAKVYNLNFAEIIIRNH
jgi:hypothetical protein